MRKTTPKEYRYKGHRFSFRKTIVMGILNITPDSFCDGGLYCDPKKAERHAKQMIEQGAGIIDVGGESSRPGAQPVSAEEEARRVIPVIRKIVKRWPSIPVSIDSYKPEVTGAAMENGAVMINDISGLRDPAMARLAAHTGAPVVIMHMKGTPGTMQKRPAYKDVVDEIVKFFRERLRLCRKLGIKKVILDPGIGFGKTGAHNLEILRRLDEISALGYPVLVGLSRKSFIGKTVGAGPERREAGTMSANAIAISKGARIIRVHDVEANHQAARMADCINAGAKFRETNMKD